MDSSSARTGTLAGGGPLGTDLSDKLLSTVVRRQSQIRPMGMSGDREGLDWNQIRLSASDRAVLTRQR
jgi:hypothetical protein